MECSLRDPMSRRFYELELMRDLRCLVGLFLRRFGTDFSSSGYIRAYQLFWMRLWHSEFGDIWRP